jgi:hypothetical protein
VVAVTDAAPSLTKLKKEYSERYTTEVKQKLDSLEKVVGDAYRAALTRLENEFLTKNDIASVIQVRTELARFNASGKGPGPTDVARHPKLAELQRSLSNKLGETKKSLLPVVTKLNGDFTSALARLANSLFTESKKDEGQAVKDFREAGLKMPDYLGMMAGLVDAPTNNKGEIVEGNVAQASMGATAKADTNPAGLIDGIDEQEASGWSDLDNPLVISFNKIYLIEQIAFHIPTNDKNGFQYILEGSVDEKSWSILTRKVGEDTRGYQFINITPQPLKAFRIIPKKVSGMKHFLVEEVAAFCQGKKPATWGRK